MIITKKPQVTATRQHEAEVATLIEKGGSPARQGEKNKRQFIQLRLEPTLLTSIDAVLYQRKVKIPRHTWILEALYEKLEREEQPSN